MDTTIPIAEIAINSNPADMVTEDIFIYLKARTLLNDMLNKEAVGENFISSDILKARIDSIEFALQNERYDAAKYMLASIDTNTTTLII